MWGAGTSLLLGEAKDIGKTALAIKESNKAWQRQKTVLQNAIQWRVSDLRKAGINPILAASGALGGVSAPSVSTASLPAGNAGADTLRAATDVKRGDFQKKQAQSQVLANNAVASAQEAKAARDREGVNTELAHQKALQSQALQAESNAQQAAANAEAIRLTFPKLQTEAEIFENPIVKRFIQARLTTGSSGFEQRILGILGGAAAAGVEAGREAVRPKEKKTPKRDPFGYKPKLHERGSQ